MSRQPIRSILVVDDEADVRSVIAYQFRQMGCMVSEAASVAEALELLSTGTFHAVVSDLRMPERDGDSLCRQVKTEMPHLPFFILTGSVFSLDQVRARCNPDGIFTKPSELPQLREAVAKRLGMSAHPNRKEATVTSEAIIFDLADFPSRS